MIEGKDKLALLYNFTSVYTNIPSCRGDKSKMIFPLQEGIFVNPGVFVQQNTYILTNKTITFKFIHQIFKSITSSISGTVLSKSMNSKDQRKGGKS